MFWPLVFLQRLSSSPSPSTPIPPEIIDIIIDHLHSDVPTLANCALVCSSWLPSSRYHFFHKVPIVISPPTLNSTLDILDSPLCTCTSYVSRVVIKDIFFTNQSIIAMLDDAIKRLAAFASVNSLRLDIVNWECLGPTTQRVLLSLPNEIKELGLSGFECNSFEDFTSLVRAYPSLRRISFEQYSRLSQRPHAGVPVHSQQRLLSQLRSLHIATSVHKDVLGWLLSFEHVPAVHTLTLGRVQISDVDIIGKFLRGLGTALRHLKVDVSFAREHFFRAVDLSHNTELRSILLYTNYRQVPGPQIWYPTILSRLSSPHIEEIVLCINVRHTGALIALDWAGLDELISQPQFAGLHRLKWIVFDDTWQSILWPGSGLVGQKLPLCNARGILEFDYDVHPDWY